MSTAEAPANEASGGARVLNPLVIENWDSRLKKFPEATFFHSAAWAQVLHSTYGYQPAFFTTGSIDDIRFLLPVMEVNSWLTGRRGVSLPFTDECEPLGTNDTSSPKLLEQALAYAKKRNWKYLECRGGRNSLRNVPASASYYTHHLALGNDESAMLGSFESSVRRALKKAGQSKLTIEFSQSPAAIRTFYGLFCMTRQRHGVPPQPFAFFANIQRYVLAQNHGWVVLASHEGVAVAGAVFFHFNKSVNFKFGASNEAFQHLRGNNLVMWEAIRHYAREGFKTFNFGRTALHNKGLRHFKRSWGSIERSIDYFRFDLREGRYVTVKAEADGLANRLCRTMPRFVSRLVGFILYKHVAVLLFFLGGSLCTPIG